MKELLFFFVFIFLFNFKQIISKKDVIHKNNLNINGVYYIKSLLNKKYFSNDNNTFFLSKKLNQIKISEKRPLIYCIVFKEDNSSLGIDDNNRIIIYDQNFKVNTTKILWKIKKLYKSKYIIKNMFNHKYIMIYNDNIIFTKIININSKKEREKYMFIIFQIFEINGLLDKNHLEIIEKEPIDVLIKYIDLRDKSLKRKGIKQIYKDFDNEELRYSVRSILENIPWVRKIFILMPNEKVRYFRPANIIKEKIVYIKDKDLIGCDSANIFAFTFNLFKMEKFNISKNFIYMEDDFFIGKPLNKSDFFYYDEKEKKVVPYILTSFFKEIFYKRNLNEYNKLFEIRKTFNPHSGKGWRLSVVSTNKYFFEKYNLTSIIDTHYTHTAMPENIDDLKVIFKEIKNYKYLKETLYSKERHTLTLNQPHFLNLYQLNIKHKKVNPIPHRYIHVEKINTSYLYLPLFVLNTCGDNKPSKNEYKSQKYIMERRFPYPTKYELINYKEVIKYSFKYYWILIFIIIKFYIKFLKRKRQFFGCFSLIKKYFINS